MIPYLCDETATDMLASIKEDAFSGGLEEARTGRREFERRLMEVFNALDFLIFGLVVFASSMNRAGCFGDNSTTWKMLMNVASLMFMIIFGTMFISHVQWQAHPDTIDYTVLRIASVVLAGWSILMGIATHKKLSKVADA